MGEGEEEPSRRPWWAREDRELSVDAHARSSREGQQEIGRYLRTITPTEIAFTCLLCGSASQREQYPGPRPRYCSDPCRAQAERRSAAARMRSRRHTPSSRI